MGGPNQLSCIGSSIHLFQNYKFAHESRVKQHIMHAENHRVATPHSCKQPLLYGAMSMNLHLWYTLPIANITNAQYNSKKPTVLRKIELNLIKATNSPLNAVGLRIRIAAHQKRSLIITDISARIKPRSFQKYSGCLEIICVIFKNLKFDGKIT